jgi:hypothetical protein
VEGGKVHHPAVWAAVRGVATLLKKRKNLPVEGGKAMGVHHPAVSTAVRDVAPLLKER